MSGLEKILSSIRDDACGEAQALINQAKDEAARILADEKSKSDAHCAQIEEQAKLQARDIERAYASSMELQHRRKLLETKQEILQQTMEQALSRLYGLPDEDYFNILLKMASSFAEQGQGELLLDQKDLKRCPKDFQERLEHSLPSGAALSISQATRPIDGGFILKYGDIEQNCSFRALFDARWDELTDKARAILFS